MTIFIAVSVGAVDKGKKTVIIFHHHFDEIRRLRSLAPIALVSEALVQAEGIDFQIKWRIAQLQPITFGRSSCRHEGGLGTPAGVLEAYTYQGMRYVG